MKTSLTSSLSIGALRPVALASWLAATAGGVALAPPAAHAQPSSSPAAAARSYSIAAGPLGPALSTFAGQSGITLAFTPDQANNLRTPGVQGTYSVPQALAQLLTGTGLQAVAREGGAYTLRSAPVVAAATAATAPSLAEVRVAAQTVYNDGTTEGTGSYTAAGPSALATGLGLSLRQTPQSVTVFTRQRMDDFKLETLSDVLEQTPGVTVDRQNETRRFNIRGSTANQQVDGMRQLADGWAVTGHTLYTLDDMAEFDRVEVLKGSSGLINGDGNYGGTINLVRKRPTREFQAHVEGGFGSWSSLRAQADLSGPLNVDASLRGRLVLSDRQADGFRDNQSSHSKLLYGTAEYDLTPDTLLSAGITYRERSLRGSGTTQPIQAYSGAGEFIGYMPRSYNNGGRTSGYDQQSVNLFARLEQRFANGWSGRLQIASEHIDVPDMPTSFVSTAVPDVVSYGRYQDIKTRNNGVELNVKGPFSLFGREHELLIGAGYGSSRNTQLRGNFPTTTMSALGLTYAQGGGALPEFDLSGLSYTNDLFSRKRSYLYAASQLNIADPVKLILGARSTNYDQNDVTNISWYNYNYRERGVFTPFAGLTVDVSRDVSLYASYASIFNVQGARDANRQTLPPEEGLTYEIGAKGEFFDKRLNTNAAFFWLKTDNTAETVGRTASGETISRAVSGATRRGWELEVSGELARGWQAQGSFVLNNSSLSTASTTPEQQFKIGSTYRFGRGLLNGLTIGGAARWQDAISTSRGVATLRQDAFWLVDLMARYQINRNLSISANVNNAFDKKYFAGIANFNNQGMYYTWGAPRSLNVSARYDF